LRLLFTLCLINSHFVLLLACHRSSPQTDYLINLSRSSSERSKCLGCWGSRRPSAMAMVDMIRIVSKPQMPIASFESSSRLGALHYVVDLNISSGGWCDRMPPLLPQAILETGQPLRPSTKLCIRCG